MKKILIFGIIFLSAACGNRNYVKAGEGVGFKAFVFVTADGQNISGSADVQTGNGQFKLRVYDNLLNQRVVDMLSESNGMNEAVVHSEKTVYQRKDDEFSFVLTSCVPLLFHTVDADEVKKVLGSNDFTLENNWIKDILYRSSPETVMLSVLRRFPDKRPSRFSIRAESGSVIFDITGYGPLDFVIEKQGYAVAKSELEKSYFDWWRERNGER